MPRLYFDNAATSWPKPSVVYDAVDRYQRELGSAVGRSATRAGATIQKQVDRCRSQLAVLLGAASAQSIHFGFNGTDVLNMVLHGWLRAGDHVVTSVAEHNSILRPLNYLQKRFGLEIDYLPVDQTGRIDPETLARRLRPATRLIALTHASNVTGAIQPIFDVARIARDTGTPLLIDAAQTAGHVPINVAELGVDFLACSGHKGLLGPLGTGVLFVRPDRISQLEPFRQGGTGTASDSEETADSGPERQEAGNHNAPGLAGLGAAVDWILDRGVNALRAHEQEFTGRLLDGLEGAAIRMFPSALPVGDRVGTVSIQFEHFDPQTAAAILENEFGIEARAGLHCAPRMHAALGTASQGGTLRFSIGPFTTSEEIDAVAAAVHGLSGA